MRRQVIINGGVSSFYGWGVLGLNLALQWAADPDLEPVCALPLDPDHLAGAAARLAPFVAASAELQAQLAPHAGQAVAVQSPTIAYLDQRFVVDPAAHGVILRGKPEIGVTFFQDTRLVPEAVARAADFPVIVAGSTWNQRLLEAHGLTNVRRILQGVDPALFHPGPRRGAFGDRFTVFSGGKLERRKAQDLVIAAFARFAKTRPDAILVTAWGSPWPELARELDAGGVAAPVTLNDRGHLDVAAWAAANGAAPAQVLDLGLVANARMPEILREMDVALFPNRGEGGTNLVAMEAMACGVPAILAANTGHLDLIEPGNSYPLARQAHLPDQPATGDVPGWGESDLDEIVAALEAAYDDREDARRRGAAGAQTLCRLTWARMAAELKALVLELA